MNPCARTLGWNALILLALLATAANAADPTAVPASTAAPPDALPAPVPAPAKDAPAAPAPAAGLPWWSPVGLPFLGTLGMDSWSELLHPGAWSGNLQTSYAEQREDVRQPGTPDDRFETRLLNESVTIRNEGFYVIDPDLLRGDLGLRLTAQQNRQDADEVAFSQHGGLTEYNFDATVLAEKPYTANFFANRAESITTQLAGGSTEVESEHSGALFRMREDNFLRDRGILPYFTASVGITQEHDQESTTVAGNSFLSNNRLSMFDFACHNGGETSDLDFHFNHTNLIDEIYAPGSYNSNTANLNNSHDFGSTLNERWDQRISYQSRDGVSPLSNLTVDELLTWEHNANLTSAYYYEFLRQTTVDGTVTANSAGLNVVHKLFANLTTNASLSGQTEMLPGGKIDTGTASLNFSYNHSIPWSGQLVVSLGGIDQITNNELQAGYVPVIDSSFQAPQPLGAGAGFVLKDLFIQAASISIVDLKGGQRVTITEGIDYLVIAQGDQTFIQPLVTSAIVQPGDTLLVSYVYNIDPSLKYRTLSDSASVGVDWRWFGMSVSHDESVQRPMGGGDSTYLVSYYRDAARLNLQGTWEQWQARGDVTVTHYNETTLEYIERRLSQHVSYLPNEDLRISLSGDIYRVDYSTPVRQTSGWSGRLDVDWVVSGPWFINGSVSRRLYEDTSVPSELITEAIVKVRRNWTKLDLALLFSAAEHARGGVDTTTWNVQLTATRRF